MAVVATSAEVTETLDRAAQLSTQQHGLEVARLSMRINAIHNPRSGFSRQLRRPLMLRAVRELGYWVVSDRVSLAYGTSPKLSDAIADYMADWEDRLRWLEADESQVAPGCIQELAVMRRLMA